MVEEVLPRTSEFPDPPVANVDQVLLVFAMSRPPFDPQAATRFLVASEAAGIPVLVLLNKADLVPEDELNTTVKQV
jgi:ribosome biogenesis GTPase